MENINLQFLMNDIKALGDAKFGIDRAINAEANHLKKEAGELSDSLMLHNGEKNEETDFEFADCFLLILHAAKRYGLTANELIQVARNKMKIVAARKYGPRQEDGTHQHISE